MGRMRHVEHHAEARLDASHVIGGKLTHLVAQRGVVHVQLSDEMRQFTRVDLHRTRGGTESIGGAGLVAIVLILLPEGCCALRILARSLQFTDLTLHGNTHPRRECQAARHTVDFAEAALNTLVGALHLFDGLFGCREFGIHQIVSTVGHALKVVVEHR